MAVRYFDGVDDRITLGSTGLALTNDAYSIVVLSKPANLTTAQGAFLGLNTSGSLVGDLYSKGLGRLALNNETSESAGLVGMTEATWQLLAVTRAAGTTTPRFHRKVLGSGAWTHANGDATIADIAGETDAVVLGAGKSSGSFVFECEIAVAAVFQSALSDADVEAIQTTPTTQFLADLGAVGLWELNQASTATAVTDSAGGSDQVAIVGTTVITGDDPSGWTFGVTVIPPLDITLRLSGGASNANPALSIGGIQSSVEADSTLFDDVSNSERTAGIIDYRLLYVHNGDVDEGDVTVYVPTQLESGRSIAIGIPTQAAGVTVPAVANDTTAPTSVTFSAPATVGTGLSLGIIPAGSSRGLWLRRTVSSGTAVDPTNHAKVSLEIARTS